MNFEESHAAFIDDHLERRSGERKGRLTRGHQHGEQLFLRNVWWPIQGNLNDLHPEYEVLDWRGRSYFADLRGYRARGVLGFPFISAKWAYWTKLTGGFPVTASSLGGAASKNGESSDSPQDVLLHKLLEVDDAVL